MNGSGDCLSNRVFVLLEYFFEISIMDSMFVDEFLETNVVLSLFCILFEFFWFLFFIEMPSHCAHDVPCCQV